ncbi:LacI family DNA-binding transcriptional regulator [Pseudalkalibacillus sp. R45]|uniref:LacI family DNA-binding transcriptional regulator n=1 Tax=Pseudalkalibacillus sp. R45 TaxID=3457433 RepID=UPI003FCD4908
MPTIRDVAKAAGVSVATVSRVINKNEYVNKDTEQKVLKVMKELDFKPSLVARGLAGKKMNTIALMLPDISNPFFPEVARAVEDVAQQYDHNLFLCNSDNLEHKEKSYLEIMKKKNIDGVIIISNNISSKDLEHLRETKIPVVLLDRPASHENYSVVRANNYKGAQLATMHLLEIGCRKIAHIAGPKNLITAKERLKGYNSITNEYPWFEQTLIAEGNFDVQGGKTALKKLLADHPDIDGIFASNDLMALGALKELKKMGKEVPQEVAICGFDGIYLTELSEPELTTIQQPIYELGAKAAEILIKKLRGELTETKIYELDVQLIKRESTNGFQNSRQDNTIIKGVFR